MKREERVAIEIYRQLKTRGVEFNGLKGNKEQWLQISCAVLKAAEGKIEPEDHALFEWLNDFVHKGRCKKSQEFLRKIHARRKHYSDEEIKKAATNLMNNKWMMGNNPDGRRYATIMWLVRSDEDVEKALGWSGEKSQYEQLREKYR